MTTARVEPTRIPGDPFFGSPGRYEEPPILGVLRFLKFQILWTGKRKQYKIVPITSPSRMQMGRQVAQRAVQKIQKIQKILTLQLQIAIILGKITAHLAQTNHVIWQESESAPAFFRYSSWKNERSAKSQYFSVTQILTLRQGRAVRPAGPERTRKAIRRRWLTRPHRSRRPG